jgi:hypothetical protein
LSLQARLAALKAGSAVRVPADVRAVMGQATTELRASGIMDGAIKVGDSMPAFALPNQHGETVTSADVLANGPMVLTVFRGIW